jgi:hypothetical protein
MLKMVRQGLGKGGLFSASKMNLLQISNITENTLLAPGVNNKVL